MAGTVDASPVTLRAVDGWHWLAASVDGLLLIVLILLRYDTYRERKGRDAGQATRKRRRC